MELIELKNKIIASFTGSDEELIEILKKYYEKKQINQTNVYFENCIDF